MNQIIKISSRNIWRHKSKSIVIGIILFIGALLMTVGNGVISGLNRGIQKNMVEGFTGDVVLISDKHTSDNAFMEAGGKQLEAFTNYKSIDSVLKTIPNVQKSLPIGKNLVMTLNEEGGNPLGQALIGVDYKQYRDFFGDNLKIVEGTFPNPGEKGVLITAGFRNERGDNAGLLYTCNSKSMDTSTLSADGKKSYQDWIIKNTVVYMGQSVNENTTTDIRSSVKAVFKYRCLNSLLSFFHIIDIESYRECMGYFSANEKKIPISGEYESLLKMEKNSMDDMFSESNIVTSVGQNDFKELSVGSLVRKRDSTVNSNEDINAGAFNLVLLRLKDNTNLDKSVAEINKVLKEHNLGVRATSWKKTVDPASSLAMIIKFALFLFVMGLFFVAVVIIVNTLSMAALERTSEIGMMRAVGAHKRFISAMFFGETAILSFIFGGIGIVCGIFTVNILSMLKLSSQNDMVAFLYGGEIFSPFLSASDIVLAVVQLVIVTLIAVVYPIRVARRITPLDAISKD